MSILHFPHRRAKVIDIARQAVCPKCGSRVRVVQTRVDSLAPTATPSLPRYVKHNRPVGEVLCRGSYTVVGVQER